MKNEEAKFILGGYRANGSDAADPVFGEALQQAQADPAMRVWFERQQRYDAIVAAKIGEITPPAGLREAILAGSKVSSVERASRHLGVWFGLAAAAAIMVIASVSLLPGRAGAAPAALADFAIQDVAFADHETHGAGVSALRARLAQNSTRLAEGLALDAKQLRAMGCRTLSVRGTEVFEVCFQRNGTWFHLYVATGGAGKPSLDKSMLLKQENKFSCATWVDAATGVRYALVTDRGMDAVKSLL